MNYSVFSTGQLATLACTLDVTIPKPGNVHRGADFHDTTMEDFLVSAIAIGPAMDRASERPLGRTVLDCILATKAHVQRNTNLGIVLLLAPLARVANPDTRSIIQCLESTNQQDASDIYDAIRIANPGGLGAVSQDDVSAGAVPEHILTPMRAAADRDMIARQYSNGFADVLEFVLPRIASGLNGGLSLSDSVISAHISTMHEYPDSLIARKCGADLAREASRRAGNVMQFSAGSPEWLAALEDLDFWLRSDGNRRNPGTSADLLVAALFAGMRLGGFG